MYYIYYYICSTFYYPCHSSSQLNEARLLQYTRLATMHYQYICGACTEYYSIVVLVYRRVLEPRRPCVVVNDFKCSRDELLELLVPVTEGG